MDEYEHGFFDGPGMTMWFLMYDVEVVRVQWMSHCGAVLENMGRFLEIFLYSVLQCPT